MRRISIFGATGSIGESTFDLIRREGGADAFHVANGQCIVREIEPGAHPLDHLGDFVVDRHLPEIK